jgi:hypothetical protein
MKKSIFIFVLFIVSSVSSQVHKNSRFWSVSTNVGGHAFFSHFANNSSIRPYTYVNTNAIYKLTPLLGIRPGVHYHNFTNGTDNVNYTNMSIDIVIDANQFGTTGYREKKGEMSVLMHSGFGFSTMWKDRLTTEDPFIKGNDDMMSVSFGVTTRYRINRRMLINADVTYVTHLLQDQFFDFSDRKARGAGGGFMRFSFGVTYELIR